MDAKVAEDVRLFNSQKFFEAHEALEEVWLKTKGREKILLHGLIQVAAAFHHHSRGNIEGFRSLLEKGLRKLYEFENVVEGIDLENLRGQLQPWRDHLNSDPQGGSAHIPLPKIPLNAAIR